VRPASSCFLLFTLFLLGALVLTSAWDAAPEVLEGKGYGKEVDWWSFGTLMFEMFTGLVRPPFILLPMRVRISLNLALAAALLQRRCAADVLQDNQCQTQVPLKHP